jgi:hypothetical protein
MSGDRGKLYHGYAQDGIEPLKSMMPQIGSRGTPPLSSAMPKAAPEAPATSAPTVPAVQSGNNSGGSK